MKKQQMKKLRKIHALHAAITLCAMLGTSSAMAVSITPGMSSPLAGTTELANADLAGVVIRDQLIPFQVSDTLGNVILEGNVQDRVVRSNNTGELIFAPRLRDLSNPFGVAWVSGFGMEHYGGYSTDIDYRTDSVGDVGANSVSRSGDGENLFFRYDPNLIVPADAGLFLSVATDAHAYQLDGVFTVYAQNDFGGSVFSSRLTGVAAPSPVPLPAAAWLFGTGLAGMIGIMRRRRSPD